MAEFFQNLRVDERSEKIANLPDGWKTLFLAKLDLNHLKFCAIIAPKDVAAKNGEISGAYVLLFLDKYTDYTSAVQCSFRDGQILAIFDENRLHISSYAGEDFSYSGLMVPKENILFRLEEDQIPA